ncbi:hypothetical protein [Brucella anthropi]|uniref:hypothetical protein n=1 Tax=Brucella anthropi TaxID=529 RepID=UPI0005B92DA7|nr:hypothetical protein [Brucella anthropi]KIU68431.1 hypothetical protein TR92_11235 [Brucella anthropi]
MKHLSYFDRAMKSPDRRYLRIFEKMGYREEPKPVEEPAPKPKAKRKAKRKADDHQDDDE